MASRGPLGRGCKWVVGAEHYDFLATLRAAREASARGVMATLKAKGQVGYPPTITADALLGYSVAPCQSAEIFFGSREGNGSILVRPECSLRARARAHPGAKNEWAQRAKVR